MSTKNSIKKLFENKDLYLLALTHKSWVNENKGKRESNERLEYLGDAILEFVVSKEIFNKFPNKSEGYLTALRANLVNTVNLSEVANKLNIGEQLYLSRGEEEGGGRMNASILANTVEAIIGALYLDGGIKKCEEFIGRHLLATISKKISKPLKDAKSRLQELVQSKGFPAPKYKVIKEFGPDHKKRFKIEVLINNKAQGSGVGKNKAEAAQEAARKALARFE